MNTVFEDDYKKMLDEGLSEAITAGDIRIYLQPQYNSVSGELIGAECLSRWKHKTEGFLNPGQFITALEETGRIYELDRYVWETACSLIRKWKDMGHILSLSVNISRKDIEQDDLPTVFSKLVEKYGIEPALLRLEITESIYMDEPQTLIALVNRLASLGFHVEMDDFGSGFSSLNLLHDMYVDVLKLDMGFLKDTQENKRSGNIINAVVKMAHTLDMKVIAEGVETRDQVEFLKNIGCLMAQGFLFSKPIPVEEFEKLLLESSTYDLRRLNRNDFDFNVDELFDRTSSGYFIFNNCMGSAALLEYDGKNMQAVVVNDSFIEELERTREQVERHRNELFSVFTENTRRQIRRMIDEAREEGIAVGELFSVSMKKYVDVKLRYVERRDNADLFFCEIADITDKVKMRRKMARLERAQLEKRRYEKKLQVVLQVPGIVLYEYDPNTDEMTISVRNENGEFRERSTTEYLAKLKERNWIHAEDVDRYIEAIQSIKEANDHVSVSARSITSEGIYCHAKYHFMPFCDEDGRLLKVMGRAEQLDADIHESYLENLPVGTFRYIADGRQEFEFVGKGVLRLLGYSNEEEFRKAYNNSFMDFVYIEDRERVMADREEQMKGGRNYYCEYRVVDAGGNIQWMYDAGIMIIDEKGIRKFNVAMTDMNHYKEGALRREKNMIEQVAAYKEDSGKDSMTELYNHNTSLKKIQESMENGEKGIFAIIDIDNFKAINDTHGHVIGDRALCGLANGMKKLFRDRDIIGRYGGDEFVFFVRGTTSKSVARKKAEALLEMAAGVLAAEDERMTLSIGIVSDSSKADDVTELVEMADSTLYRIKNSGKGSYGFYEKNTSGRI